MSKSTPKLQTNAAIARHLAALAQQLRAKGENPFKIRAYRRAAETIAGLSDSIAAQVHAKADLTQYPGIGRGIAAALEEIVREGSLGQLELVLAGAPPAVASLTEYPKLDSKRVLRAYRKLKINSIPELEEKLASGEAGKILGTREEHHLRSGLATTTEFLLDDAEVVMRSVQDYLLKKCRAMRAEPAGSVRRRVETISEVSLIVEAVDFPGLLQIVERYGGGTERISSDSANAEFKLSNGLTLRLQLAAPEKWGAAWIGATGSALHLQKLEQKTHFLAKWSKCRTPLADEASAYRALGLPWIPPELREGHDEVALAAGHALPVLVELHQIRGDLHAHTTSSDGRHSIEEMAQAAKQRGYDYLGITDHSQSLKIAGGVTVENLWKQIRRIDELNEKNLGIRLLKSAEVDILADGTLDYPDELLAELDYTMCSIHSKFRLGKAEQTERLMRAIDNPHFHILGHATGRLLLKRPGYELDWERLITHAAKAKVAFEINASPDRLDLLSETARAVKAAGIPIAICTDAHHVRELDYLRCGLDVARRAGLEKHDVLNALPWVKLQRFFGRQRA